MADVDLGLLAIVEAGAPRLRPMLFSEVEGELWAAAFRQIAPLPEQTDGQRVDVVLLADGLTSDVVHGVLRYSTDDDDRARLWDIQHDLLAPWCACATDPNLVVLRIVPEERLH